MTGNLPTQYDPADDPEAEPPQASERSRTVALVLGILGGVFGLHRFYVGAYRAGSSWPLTLGGLACGGCTTW